MKEWSMVVELDEHVSEKDLPLLLPLGDDKVLLLTMFDTEQIDDNENKQ